MSNISSWARTGVAIRAGGGPGYRFLGHIWFISLVIGGSVGHPGVASARVLMVGPGQVFAKPSDAARAVAPGDEVRILPGTYFDCATWSADSLIIEGTGPGVTLTDASCEGKASFVISGRNVTVRDLTFTRIRVNDGNGAGIRAEGFGLRVERVRFDNNQSGLLAASQPGATIEILGCVFRDNGTITSTRVPAALEVGAVSRLIIRNSVFDPGRAGAAINSNADLTDIASSRIAASPSPPESLKSATVQVSGALLMVDTELQASQVTSGDKAAVRALVGSDAEGELTLRHNRLTGEGTLLLNWSGRTAVLDGNILGPDATDESSSGAWSYRLRRSAHATYDGLQATARHLARRAIDLARNQSTRNP